MLPVVSSREYSTVWKLARSSVKSTVAPINRGVSRAMCWLMQLSASATARPPSLQSCALLTTPDWISPSSVVCSVFACSRSQRGGEPVFWPWMTCKISAAAQALQRVSRVHGVAEQDDRVAFVLEPLRRDVLGLLDEADDGDRGRRVNRAGGTLVVERAIAAGDRRVEGAAASARPRTLSLICQNSSGLCGLGMLRLSVAPSGTAPEHARLRHASATALSRLRTDRDKRRRRCSPRSWR